MRQSELVGLVQWVDVVDATTTRSIWRNFSTWKTGTAYKRAIALEMMV